METPTDQTDVHVILSEQRRELLAAKTLDADLDLAFNLQMQEAMTASLALNPSPSTSQSPPPSQPYEPNDDVLDIAATLLLEDVERFSQEYEDHERSVLEARKAKEDLDRRIHDHKFAIDVSDLPEEYWRNHGDVYERPFCTDGASSSSSGKAAAETECLRLYCKGLISEELVKNVKMAVGGIGVAICDPRDNLVFEVKKNMEAVVEGERLSDEAAELEALVEGLNKALTMDLKNVTFFCDDNKLYQYFTNRVVPGNSKIATLVNQVALLQKEFESCSPSLVARGDIKFAFKFAREAIVSQITWQAETSNGKCLKETCVICYEETDVARMFSIDGCLHRYCISCMKQHVEVRLLNGMVAHCPHEGCKSEVNIDSYENFFLAPKLVEVMNQRIKESSIHVTDRVYCQYPKCSALMSKKEILEYTKTSYVGAEESGARKCMKCHYYFCIKCLVPWHFELTCDEYQTSHNFPKEHQMLKSLATKRLWRQCVKCNHMVELAQGCYHITCRCGYQFCYTCGAEWKDKKPCSCPLWDEQHILAT
ncbi:putative transcription factor C2H2 family [Rosa chinensis]|uniref:RBR-type E3 ubiquitin transferase n=1 Tax=Rosa chinensis TaxID=74649 RepID=A0A2P6QHS4_ROSCH|nr:uncharacterized protein LOC112167991 [Rosa chinensis]PRQ33730.1 putative transcription factor C2H2 family [Rosa chinensis]